MCRSARPTERNAKAVRFCRATNTPPIRGDKPKSNDEAKRPEFKVCKFTTDAIVTEGSDIGTIHKVCKNPDCPILHPKMVNGNGANDVAFKAEQEKLRKEEAIANATAFAFSLRLARLSRCGS